MYELVVRFVVLSQSRLQYRRAYESQRNAVAWRDWRLEYCW